MSPARARTSLPEIVAPYFDEVTAAARSGLFDALGHIDFVKRWLTPHVTPADLAAAPELYEPIIAALVESGTALEINTSGLRQAPNETYPASPIVAPIGWTPSHGDWTTATTPREPPASMRSSSGGAALRWTCR